MDLDKVLQLFGDLPHYLRTSDHICLVVHGPNLGGGLIYPFTYGVWHPPALTIRCTPATVDTETG